MYICVCGCIILVGFFHVINFQLSLFMMYKVLGAAMFYAKVGDTAMVYTGDYNMTPDRHLGAAQIDRLQLDLLITEYGTYVHKVLSCVCSPFCKCMEQTISYCDKLLEHVFQFVLVWWKKKDLCHSLLMFAIKAINFSSQFRMA